MRRASKKGIAIIKPGKNKRGKSKLTEFVRLLRECMLTVPPPPPPKKKKKKKKIDNKVTSCIGKWDVTQTHT